MAQKKYFDTAPAAGDKDSWAMRSGLRKQYAQSATVNVAADDDDGSTYLLFNRLASDTIITKLELECDAITGATDYDIGVFDSDTGVAIDADCYMNGTDIHNGSSKSAPIDGMSVLTHADTLKRVWEVAGLTRENIKGYYDIVLTANTVGSAAGKITARAEFAPCG